MPAAGKNKELHTTTFILLAVAHTPAEGKCVHLTGFKHCDNSTHLKGMWPQARAF